MLVLLLVCVFIGSVTSFAPNLPVFLAGIFVCGFSSMGYGTVMYVWMMEHVGGKYKTILGAAPHYNFGFWGLMTAVIAYLVPNWRHMHLIFTFSADLHSSQRDLSSFDDNSTPVVSSSNELNYSVDIGLIKARDYL